jgi:hypothetical protein
MPKIQVAPTIHQPRHIAKYTDAELSEKGVIFKGDHYKLSSTTGQLVSVNQSGNRFITGMTTFFQNMDDGFYLSSSRTDRLNTVLRNKRDRAALPPPAERERQAQKAALVRTLQAMPRDATEGLIRRPRYHPYRWTNHHDKMYAVFSLIAKKIQAGTIDFDNEQLKQLEDIHSEFYVSVHRGVYDDDPEKGYGQLAKSVLSHPVLTGLINFDELRAHIMDPSYPGHQYVEITRLQKEYPNLFEAGGNV